MDVASLIVKVTTTGVQTTQQQLDRLANTASSTQKVAGGLNLGMLGLSATLGLITKEAIKMGDEWTNINSKLNLVTKTTQDFNKAQTELFNISQNTRTSLSASVELYRKLAVSTESLNISQNRLLKVTETINKAGMVGGGSKESINAALIQLGQGLASGALRGEELNSVLEQTPRLAKLIADGMGVQVGALKSLAEAGKITSETIIKAAEDGAKGIAKEFDVIQVTFSSSLDVAEGSVTKLVGTLDEATGATRTLSQTIIEMSKYLNENNTDIVATGQFIYATISRTIDVFNVLYETVENTAQIVVGHINLLVYGSLEGILTLLTKATEGLNSLGIASDKGLKEAYADLAYVQGLVANANNLIADSYNDLNNAVVKLSPTIEDRIKQYNAENKAISDKLALQKKELETTTGKSKKEVEAELKAEKEKEEARKKAQKDAIKLAEEWQKRKIEIATNIAIAEQDELAKPFIVLEAKYKEDLEKFKGNKEAQLMLTNEYNAEVSRLQKDLTEKFNEEEKKRAEKSAEWKVKLLEANEKYNDEIIKMQDDIYGTDTSVDAWYNNQLEYLGKLSQEAGATSEELQTLLDKIETIKAMKLEKQTISFKVEQSFYQSFENNLADSIEGAFNGKLNLSSFFNNIGRSVLGTFSGGIANNITTGLRTGSFASGLRALGLGSTSAVASDGGILSDLSTLSTIKSLYGLASNGISGSVLSGFNSIAGGFDALGMTGVGNTVGQFGYGFANPFTANTSFGAIGAGSTIGGLALGGGIGYGVGSLGDALFGANTKAGSFGAIGGALGSLGGPIGIAIGSALGSVIGGLFGSTKQTDAGLSFGSVTGMGQGFDEIQAYADMKKKSWFSSKSWTNYTDLTQSEINQIKGIFDTYDYLLAQLGDTDRIILEAGKYTGQSFQDVVAKKFIEAFTDVSQSTDDTIYQAWVKYAESVDSTVIEALSASINTFIATTRSFDVWALNRSGQGIEALAQQAQWAQEDFSNLSNMLGVTGVTVENYTKMYKEAVKNSLTPETITQWQSLGTALMTATNAADAYAQSVKAQQESQYQATLSSLSNIYALNIKIADLQIQKALVEQGITQDNLTALQAQKSSIKTIMDMATNMRDKLLSESSIPNVYKSVLESARIDFSKGDYSSDNISRLGEVSELYADSLQKYSLSEADYQFGVLKIASEIESITGKTTTLADVESEIERVTKALQLLEPTIDSQLDALYAQKDAYVTQTDRQIATLESLLGVDSPIIELLRAALDSSSKGGIDVVLPNSLNSNPLDMVMDIFTKYDLHQYQTSDTSGYEWWANQVTNGNLSISDLDASIKKSAEEVLGRPLGFASGGYTGNIGINDIAGVVHGQEYVVNAQTTKDLGLNGSGGAFAEMVAELASLRKLMVKLVSDNTKQLSTQRAILGERVS